MPLNTDWRARAVCKDENPELFFPIGNTGSALWQVEEAKAMCRLHGRCGWAWRCAWRGAAGQ
ncbi:WhiB family transcriptional regulator [Streptomyces pactum]|uniref:WhiB family transcriptional regulator n=1 Tax=Streptomyces pactum TaxID=68249 RepID=A0ABS0NUC0_9ACTN|nr:WhiB family transcriptional regulator [Streptomyces pactum]MBH5338796.1 WhiB family transcriptional regulator [Streptomyces pactum]